jgi:hypothetical protein
VRVSEKVTSHYRNSVAPDHNVKWSVTQTETVNSGTQAREINAMENKENGP